MSTEYRSEQIINIAGWDCGTEIEMTMAVKFKVHPGSKATEIYPAEEPTAELTEVHFFEIKGGKVSPDEATMPVWLINRLTEGDAFYSWLLTEAADQHQAAIEDAADARREMMREGR